MSNQPNPPAILAQLFRRNGYVRRQNQELFKSKGSAAYKKGAEVRLVLRSLDEFAIAWKALTALDFVPGKAFVKERRIVLPIYGKKAVDRFLAMINEQSVANDL